MRWVPARPTYLFASPAVDDALHRLRDGIDLVGTALGYDLGDAVRAVSGLLGVDALHADPLAEIGVDLRASWAVFSEDLAPTAVIHLAAPAQMTAFLDRQRERGLVTQSVIVDGSEVSSASLLDGSTISWAIAGDWMWIHLAPPLVRDDGASWFTASHAPHRAAWSDGWAWAQRAAGAAAGVVGLLDLHGAVARIAARLPGAVGCAALVKSIGLVAVSLEGDERHFAARLAIDVGPTDAIRGALLPPPSGWGATAAQAALAVQWNLDLPVVRARLAPCLAGAGVPVATLDQLGVRAARALLLGFDPDATSGAGAVSFDLTGPAFLERQLDRIPLRRTFERARTFGAHKGYALAIPFKTTIEYVLEPTLAIAAVGDGVLARIAGPGGPGDLAAAAPASPPIFAIDVAPPALSAAAWEAILHVLVEHELAGTPGAATRRAAAHVMQWREGHFAVTAEPTALVVTLSGQRR